MPTLDDLSTTHPAAQIGPLDRMREAFVTDFGDITGEFAQAGSVSEFRATLDGQPVTIRLQTSPRGEAEYVINGNLWHPPGDLRVLPLGDRQALLVSAVRRYL